jgi:hypothetical protein
MSFVKPGPKKTQPEPGWVFCANTDQEQVNRLRLLHSSRSQ